MKNKPQPTETRNGDLPAHRHRCHRYTGFSSGSLWMLLLLTVIFATILAAFLNQASIDETSTKFTYVIDVDNDDEKINWDNYPTTNIELTTTVNIVSSGTYHFAGSLKNGMINVNNPNGQVKLILDNVSIENNSGPVIYCQAAENLVIELIGENSLIDGRQYSAGFDKDVTGVIYSKSDLAFQGDGKLNIMSNYQDGIVGKDDLKFKSGTFVIDSQDDAIRGKDSVYIKDGNFIINSVADAIKTTNLTDVGKGFILIENGNFNIRSSAKGLTATEIILLHGGVFSLETHEDAIRADNYIGIKNGEFHILSGDDAVHADRKIVVDGGELTIVRALEGLESYAVVINGGIIKLNTLDDGINAIEKETATSNEPISPSADKGSCSITINGGDIYINAAGDGIDSNGWIYFNGGTTIVDGPTDDKNSALDATMGMIINGGKIIAIGNGEKVITFSNTSSVYSFSAFLGLFYPAGTKIEIKDEYSNTLISYFSAKAFDHLLIGLPEFDLGIEYSLYIGDTEYHKFFITDIVTIMKFHENEKT